MASTVTIPEKLPHQIFFETLGKGVTYKTFFNKENDPKGSSKMNFGRIESRMETAAEMPEETEEEIAKKQKEIDSVIASSEKWAGVALELHTKTAEAAGAAVQVQADYTRIFTEGVAFATEGKFPEAIESFTQALALNVNNEEAAAEIEKVKAAILATEQANATAANTVEYANFMDSAIGRAGEKDFEQALILANKALATGINNEEAQQLIDQLIEGQKAETVFKNAEGQRKVIGEITEAVKTKGQITHQELVDFGVDQYPADAKTWTLGNDEIGAKVSFEKISEGVYKLHADNTPAAAGGTPNQFALIIKWIVGLAVGGGALYILWKNRSKILPKFFPPKQ